MLTTFAYGFGWQEALIVGGIVVLLFGGQKLPELARGVGESIREFKQAVSEEKPADNPAVATVADKEVTEEDKDEEKEKK